MFKKMILALAVACAAGFAMPSKAEAGGCHHYGYGGGFYGGGYGGGYGGYNRPFYGRPAFYGRPSFYGPAFGPGFYGRGFGGPRGGLYIGF